MRPTVMEMTPRAPVAAGDDLEFDWRDTTLTVRSRSEAPPDRPHPRMRTAPGHVVVLVSAVATAHPDLGLAVVAALRAAVRGPGVRTVWLAPTGPAPDPAWVRVVLAEFAVDVMAPRGPLLGTPETGLYAGPGGWHRFSREGAPVLAGDRFPVPAWERALPRTVLNGGDVVAEPVLAGLVLRRAAGPVMEWVSQVPLDPVRPRLVVDGVLPTQAAALLTSLAPAVRESVVVVPGDRVVAGLGWMSHVAESCGHPILFNTGVPAQDGSVVAGFGTDRTFRPFATVLRQRPGTVEQEVCDVAPAPSGWRREGPARYRSEGAVAEVVPSGLVLRDSPAGPVSAPFDPTGWTLTFGAPGSDVTAELVAALTRLLATIGTDRLRTMRIRVAGRATGPLRDRIVAIVADAGAVVEAPDPEPDGQAAIVGAQPTEVMGFPSVRRGFASTPPADTGRASRAVSSAEPSDASSLTAIGDRLDSPPVAVVTEVAGAARVLVESGPALTAPELVATGSAAPVEAPEPVQSEEDPGLVRARAWPERASTSGQQTRFAAAAGGTFTDGLSLVNSALATWPALRRDDDPGEKADYVAVCVYLTRGPGGAVALNRALRAGEAVPEDYPACLVSGLGRLAVQRGVVLRQVIADPRWSAQTVLTDPGFVSTSVRHDITVDGATADLLILPDSARRTCELVRNRPIDEAVFLPGRRFRVLAVRTAEPARNDDSDDPTVPTTAYLAREVVPDEEDTAAADENALSKLDRAWRRRQRVRPNLVDDQDIAQRLTLPMATV
ncbi:hypothetical protein [Actinophytocola oryzae]|uniref:Uncharacterized protein n=1 Tax=Actinophytocola oryzae TaxID=502181 RepID=A0A4R7UQ52_9PSEU|nr:hypothetical protein [Actinophytocola oryzae]TDV34592.1 hypothetical protein CLV71_1387 [Actinophytocola oryzae]